MNRTEPEPIFMASLDVKTNLDRTVAVSESYFALANIRHAENNLLPPLQDYGIAYDAALEQDVKRSIQRLREEIDVYEKAISDLFNVAARPDP